MSALEESDTELGASLANLMVLGTNSVGVWPRSVCSFNEHVGLNYTDPTGQVMAKRCLRVKSKLFPYLTIEFSLCLQSA